LSSVKVTRRPEFLRCHECFISRFSRGRYDLVLFEGLQARRIGLRFYGKKHLTHAIMLQF
jgi:hypothetical protein